MSEQVPEFINQKVQELLKLSKEELALKLAQLDFMLEHIPSNVRFWLENLFKPFRAFKRNYEAIFGILTGVELEVVGYEVFVEETIRRYDAETDLWERKVVKVPKTSIIYPEIIEEQKEVPKKRHAYAAYGGTENV